VKRTTFLLPAALALVLAACGSDQTDATPTPTEEPTPTVAPTEEPTPTPSEAAESPDATDDGSGSMGELADLLPDEVNGLDRTDMTGMEQFILPALEAQNIDAEDADFAFATWGEGELFVSAMRMPGITETQLELLGRLMGSAQGDVGADVETETVTIGGKDVLRVTPTDGQSEGQVYIYIVDDAFFTVVAQAEGLAEELLSQLP
jgi:hypothetical protein